MDLFSIITIFVLTYGLGYGTAYMNEDDIECKEIQYQPMNENLYEYKVKDNYDMRDKTYTVDENEYILLNKYVKGVREDLKECGTMIYTYNKDKFTIQDRWILW